MLPVTQETGNLLGIKEILPCTKHSKNGFVGAITTLLFKILRRKIGQKNSKHVHKVGKKEQKVLKNIRNHEFPASTYKYNFFAQSQLNFAPSHDGEKVTFRNSGSHLDTLFGIQERLPGIQERLPVNQDMLPGTPETLSGTGNRKQQLAQRNSFLACGMLSMAPRKWALEPRNGSMSPR